MNSSETAPHEGNPRITQIQSVPRVATTRAMVTKSTRQRTRGSVGHLRFRRYKFWEEAGPVGEDVRSAGRLPPRKL